MFDVGLDFYEFGYVKIWGVVEVEFEVWVIVYYSELWLYDVF